MVEGAVVVVVFEGEGDPLLVVADPPPRAPTLGLDAASFFFRCSSKKAIWCRIHGRGEDIAEGEGISNRLNI